jgi:hypothetical protein
LKFEETEPPSVTDTGYLGPEQPRKTTPTRRRHISQAKKSDKNARISISMKFHQNREGSRDNKPGQTTSVEQENQKLLTQSIFIYRTKSVVYIYKTQPNLFTRHIFNPKSQ